MSNPFEDQTVPLDMRVSVSNLALAYAAACVVYERARMVLIQSKVDCGHYPPAIHQAAILAGHAKNTAQEALDDGILKLAGHPLGK